MRIKLTITVEVPNQAAANEMQKFFNTWGFHKDAAKELDEAMHGGNFLVAAYIKRLLFKLNPFS